jgi:hypothetical protein
MQSSIITNSFLKWYRFDMHILTSTYIQKISLFQNYVKRTISKNLTIFWKKFHQKYYLK